MGILALGVFILPVMVALAFRFVTYTFERYRAIEERIENISRQLNYISDHMK